jgi:patatin-like phospholipase/acyl hydrolase
VRILAIDGGGIRGIIPAIVLADLERRAARPVAELFDLLAGTSTGGVLACALLHPTRPRTAAALVELYREEGPRIFRLPLGRRVATGFGLLEERYDDDDLNAVLERELGDAPLAEARRDLLVTAYDLEARRPYLYKSWRPTAGRQTLREAARATSAAPTYFEPLRVVDPQTGRAMSLVDGGVFATNPSLCALAEVRRRDLPGVPRLVSLGTGELTRRIRHEEAAGWGLVEWVRPLLDVVFDGVADTVDYQALHLLDGRYDRFQVALDRGTSDALDDARPENLERLEARGRELVAASAGALERLAEQLTAPAG